MSATMSAISESSQNAHILNLTKTKKTMEKILLQSITVDELKEIIRSVLDEKVILKPPSVQKEPSAEYLTRKQVCKLLNISLSTLYIYSKRGIIKSYKIGGHVLYRHDEITDSVVNQKYKHL
jgi:excisionase family DNA binding protein